MGTSDVASRGSPTAVGAGDVGPRAGGPARPRAALRQPETPDRPSGWTGGRITALVIGALMTLISLGPLGGGGTALWVDRTQRDAAGYVATGVHEFSTVGSALTSERIDLGSPGVGWLYSQVMLGEVRVRVAPVNPGSAVFVGIGPSADVDRYLAGASRTLISDFWTDRVETIRGGAPGSAPGTQEFWVASATGPGHQSMVWDPADGSWTVVVMNADGRPGIAVVDTELGARMPALLGIAVGGLVAGGVFLIGGVLLIVGAIRRSRASRTRAL